MPSRSSPTRSGRVRGQFRRSYRCEKWSKDSGIHIGMTKPGAKAETSFWD